MKKFYKIEISRKDNNKLLSIIRYEDIEDINIEIVKQAFLLYHVVDKLNDSNKINFFIWLIREDKETFIKKNLKIWRTIFKVEAKKIKEDEYKKFEENKKDLWDIIEDLLEILLKK